MQPNNLTPRRYGLINTIGFWSLCLKEIRRFVNVYTQTLIAPIVTTLLFLAIFHLALGGAVREIHGIIFLNFIAPGLIIMGMAQNAFANTSSSLVVAKVQGNIVDVLLPPISPLEIVCAFTVGGVVRGFAVGIGTFATMILFVDLPIHNVFAIFVFGFLGTAMLALLGVVGGIWADKFDHIAAVTNFVVMPFTFLSGTFYSVDRLPPLFYKLSQLNPFFYMIDGFRSGFIGHSDANIWLGAFVLLAVNVGLFALAYRMMATGFKLKS